MILAVGLHAGSKDVGRELEPQTLPGHILALCNQQFVFLLLILRPCVESCQSCFQLDQQLILLADFTVLFADLYGDTALLHGTGIRPFVHHGDALHALICIAPWIDKTLRESSFTQGFIDGIGSSGTPTFRVATVIPVGCANLSCFPAAFLLGRDAISVSIQDVLQSAFITPLSIRGQWAHGQQDVSVWVAIPLVMKGNISTHALVYKKLLHIFSDEGDVLLVVQLSRKRQFNRPCKLGVGLGFVPLNAVPEQIAIGVFRRSVGGQHDLRINDMPLAGVVMGDPVPCVFHFRSADIGGCSNGRATFVS